MSSTLATVERKTCKKPLEPDSMWAWRSYVTRISKLYQTGCYNENNKSDKYVGYDVINDSSISY